MSHIYWELHEIPRPSGSYINHSDGRVFLMTEDGLRKKKRKVIGRATSETMMHPNDLFRYLYPALWSEYYGDRNLPEHELHAGMYALSLGIGCSTNLYPILQDVYGPLYSNAIMDYAIYSIMDRTDTTQLFHDRMAGEVLFSKETYSDSWYSDLFSTYMSEDHNHRFRTEWLKECASRGITKAWISIDGANNDCEARSSDLCGKGNAKSHTNSDIVSFIWALDTKTGTPVTYFVNNGGMVDSKAFQKMASFLGNSGIEIEGVILDRGFCSHDVIRMLEECNYPYVVMLKSDTYGHTQMMEKHASEIKWNVKRVVGDDGKFGIAENGQIFGNHPQTAWINLYYDGANGTDRSIALIRKIRLADREAQESILNQQKPSIPRELQSYLSVKKRGRSREVVYDYEAWQSALDGKGFCSIASSLDLGPEKADRLYHLRDVSEKQYMIMKSQLGYDTTRVHTTEGIKSKFAVCFIASIIRSEICRSCRKLGYDSNRMIREIDRVVLVLMTDGLYVSVNNLSARQKDLLAEYGVLPEHFKAFADDVNRRRISPINSQVHQLPDQGASAKKRRGRPPKKKLEEELLPVPKRGPGRPKGSKNKKTLDREAKQQATEQLPTRKPGRPKGSKNKPRTTAPKRGRGRPRKDKTK